MNVQEFLEVFEYLSSFPIGKSNRTIYEWWDSQGSNVGIKALGFQCGCPNGESDELGLNKDGRSRRGVPPCFRPVDNSKRRGLKALPRRNKRKKI